MRLGQLYELQRQTPRARYHYQRTVALDPAAAEAANAYQWLGRDTFQRERYDSAQVYLAQALTRYPERSNLALVTRKWIASAQFAIEGHQTSPQNRQALAGRYGQFSQSPVFSGADGR